MRARWQADEKQELQQYTRSTHALCRWIYRRGPEEKPGGLPPHGEEGGQGLARIWRAGLPRMDRRGRQGRKAHLVSAQRQAQAGRDRSVLLDHLQVARATRPRERQGDGRQAAGGHDGHQVAAVRRQADDLWRLRKPRRSVSLLTPRRQGNLLAVDGAPDTIRHDWNCLRKARQRPIQLSSGCVGLIWPI